MIKLMNKTSIIPSKNSENGSLLLDVPRELVQIPEWLSVFGTTSGFKLKDEYHVTVIGLELAEYIQKHGKNSQVESLIDDFAWTIEISNDYAELAKDDENGIHRQSIICFVKIPELTQFYKDLINIIEMSINYPPTHITLYTKNYDRGIGLYSQSDLTKFKVRDLLGSSKLIH